MALYVLIVLVVLLRFGIAITPESLIEAPRRSAAVANPSGDLAIIETSTYSFTTHEHSAIWSLLNLTSGNITNPPQYDGVSEFTWVGPTNTSVLYINNTNEEAPGGVSLWWTPEIASPDRRKVASLPAKFSNLIAVADELGNIHFLLSCVAYRNGTVFNYANHQPPFSSARIYQSLPIRSWSNWRNDSHTALYSGLLVKQDASYLLGPSGLSNIFDGGLLPGVDVSAYDLNPNGPTFSVKGESNGEMRIFTMPWKQTQHQPVLSVQVGQKIPVSNLDTSPPPRLSPDGKRVAVVLDVPKSGQIRQGVMLIKYDNAYLPRESTLLAEDWERDATDAFWSRDGETLYIIAQDAGSRKLFSVPANATIGYKPRQVTSEGSVESLEILPDGTLLVFDSTILSSRRYYTISPIGHVKALFNANGVDQASSGFNRSNIDSFFFRGSSGASIRTWIIKPTSFNANIRYPFILMVHGGPIEAWADEWSVGWNFKTFADQGFVIIAPDITGSLGYGFNLTDAVINDWGGRPYYDLVNCFEYVAANLSFVDAGRGVAAGSSYGGYMVNWIQGNPLGRRFKALVSWAGAASLQNTLGSDGDMTSWFGWKNIWEAPENYWRFDPLLRAGNFSTPQFIIHGSEDYRVPVMEGILMFKALQKQGVPSRFLNFPDESHGPPSNENLLVAYREMFNWINHFAGSGVSLDNNTIP